MRGTKISPRENLKATILIPVIMTLKTSDMGSIENPEIKSIENSETMTTPGTEVRSNATTTAAITMATIIPDLSRALADLITVTTEIATKEGTTEISTGVSKNSKNAQDNLLAFR
jgi:hypothetical protein